MIAGDEAILSKRSRIRFWSGAGSA